MHGTIFQNHIVTEHHPNPLWQKPRGNLVLHLIAYRQREWILVVRRPHGFVIVTDVRLWERIMHHRVGLLVIHRPRWSDPSFVDQTLAAR